MAAIGRSISTLLLLAAAAPLWADQSTDVRAQISQIATALTTGNAADAMTPFDKSFSDYERLRRFFQGLNAFQVNSEVDVVDEQDTETATTLTVNWTLTLTDLSSNFTERRNGDINVRLIRKDKKWKIVEFSPIDLFDPQQKPPTLPRGRGSVASKRQLSKLVPQFLIIALRDDLELDRQAGEIF
jgi:hypothetical protein